MLDRRSLLKMVSGGAAFALIPSASLLAKTPGKRLAMLIDVRRCTGCLACTVSCSIENQLPVGRPRTVVTQAAVSNGKTVATLAVPNQCNHCDNPPCVPVCPAGATYKRKEDGIVVIDYDKCIHCQSCVAACPYGARCKDETFQAPPEKCNFCIHRVQAGLLPACVESCIGGARIFGDLNDAKSAIAQCVRANKVYALQAQLGTKPNVFYIGLPQPSDDQALLSIDPLDWQR